MMKPIATFSIVAYDPGRQEWGVAVQSKFLACAAVVSWARAGAGAVATQSFANMAYGPDGLAMMEGGASAAETIAALTTADDGRDLRQAGMVDRSGQAAAYTGAGCSDWAGHIVGDGFACQGNILVPGTVEAMASAYEDARLGQGELADWLVAALAAGQAAGGDRRGRQAAGVLVVRAGGGYGGNNDRYLDLRVDDDPAPLARLAALLDLHHLYFAPPKAEDRLPVSEALARELQAILRAEGYLATEPSGAWDDESKRAFFALVSRENLEERWSPDDANVIDRIALEYLRRTFGK